MLPIVTKIRDVIFTDLMFLSLYSLYGVSEACWCSVLSEPRRGAEVWGTVLAVSGALLEFGVLTLFQP